MPTGEDSRALTLWRPRLGALVVVAWCAVQSDGLLLAWRTSPFDYLGWVALLLWCLPLVSQCLRPDLEFEPGRIEYCLMGAALLVSLLGSMTSLNALKYLGLALAIVALHRWSPANILWFLGAAGWMPAFGYFAARSIPLAAPANLYLTLALRVVIALGAVILHRRLLERARPRAPEPPDPEQQGTPAPLWMALCVAAILGILWERVRLPDASDRLDRVPLKGLGFAGRLLPLDEVELKVFGRAQVINRLYSAAGQEFILTIIDGTDDRHAVHDPLYCFKGAGWRVEAQRPRRITGGEARVVRLSKDGRRVEAMIWFSDGKERHASPLLYWWQTTVRRVTVGWSGGEPILIVVQPAGDAALDWDRLFDAFPALRTI